MLHFLQGLLLLLLLVWRLLSTLLLFFPQQVYLLGIEEVPLLHLNLRHEQVRLSECGVEVVQDMSQGGHGLLQVAGEVPGM